MHTKGAGKNREKIALGWAAIRGWPLLSRSSFVQSSHCASVLGFASLYHNSVRPMGTGFARFKELSDERTTA